MEEIGVEGVGLAVVADLLEAAGAHPLEDLLARAPDLARKTHETGDGIETRPPLAPPVTPAAGEDVHEIRVAGPEVPGVVVAIAEIGPPLAGLPVGRSGHPVAERAVVEDRKIKARAVPAHELGEFALEGAEETADELLLGRLDGAERPAVEARRGAVDHGQGDEAVERKRQELPPLGLLAAELEDGLEDVLVAHRRIEIVDPSCGLAVGDGLDVEGQDSLVVHAGLGIVRPPEQGNGRHPYNPSMAPSFSPEAPDGLDGTRRSALAFRLRLLAVAWLPAAVSLCALSLVLIGGRLEHRARRVDREGLRLAASLASVPRPAGDLLPGRALEASLVRRPFVRAVTLRLPGLPPLRLVRPGRPLPWTARALAPLVRLLAPRTVPAVLRSRLGGETGSVLTLHLAARPLLRRDARTVLHGGLLLLLALGLSLLLALRLLALVLRPLGRLTDAFDRLRRGELGARVPEDAPGEFGRLARHFNRMAERIAAHREELESRIAQATAELRASLDRVARKNEELEETRRAAEAASRAKTEFLANMSHEIRTPMNAVLGYAELLGTTGLDHDQESYLEAIRTSGESLLRLIDEILDLARIETGHLRLEHGPCDPRGIAERVAAMLAPQAFQKGLEFITDFYAEPSRPVLGDGEKIRQILTNLVANAIKFTNRGAVAVTLHQHDEGDRVSYEALVEDSGTGIAPEARTRIFEPFTQADGSITRSHGGAGLGLAIARRLTEAMGGSLAYEPRAEGGSRFRLRLVLPAAGSRVAGGPDPVLAGRRALVVCADDERTRRIAGLLRAWGLEARGVSGEALDRPPEALGDVDLVVLALGAGEMLSATPWKGRWRPPPGLPVLVLAATADRGKIRRLAREFGGACLPVHAAQDEIRARLRILLGPASEVRGLVLDPEIRRLLCEELPRERAALADPGADRAALAERLHRLEGTSRFCRFPALSGAVTRARETLARGGDPAPALAETLRVLDGLVSALSIPEAASPARPPPRAASERLKGRVILVADDNRLNRELVTRMLTRHGARVEAFPDGRATLARAGEIPWAVALVDVHMPDVDGLTVLGELRHRFPERPSFALSADVLPETRKAALDAGATGYLLKPLSEERLLETLAGVLE